MRGEEHPDRISERWEDLADEDLLRERREDRLGDFTGLDYQGSGAVGHGGFQCADGPRLTSAMTTLAWTVLNGSDFDRRDACKALAELVLEASE